MRRKKKFGVYSNKNIKKCPYGSDICQVCKSVCKVFYDKAIVDPKSIAKNHPIDDKSKYKIYHIGIGSLLPRRKFVDFNIKINKSRKYSPPRDTPDFHKGKLEAYKEIKSQIKESDLENELVGNLNKKDKKEFDRW